MVTRSNKKNILHNNVLFHISSDHSGDPPLIQRMQTSNHLKFQNLLNNLSMFKYISQQTL